MIPPVRDAGYRCIAPDYAGFGRSDKPTDVSWYTYDRHVELMAALLEELDVRDATAVVHDWGGPIGLRLAVEHPDRFSRIVVMDTGPFTGRQRMSENWLKFRDFVARNEDLPVGFLVRGGCKEDPGDEVIAAYEAPYPEPGVEGGGAGVPADPPDRARCAGRGGGQTGGRSTPRGRSAEAPALGRLRSGAAVLGRRTGLERLNFPAPRKIDNAGHYLQEDAGAEIGAIIAEWLGRRGLGSRRERGDGPAGQLLAGVVAQQPHPARRPVVLEPGDRPRPVGAGGGAGVMERGGEDPAAGVVEEPAPGSGQAPSSSPGPPRWV